MDNIAYSVISKTQFIQATRDTGYRSTVAAVSELIDNAIQAEATQIQIIIAEEIECNDKQIYLAVLDNGCGMNPHAMRIALQFGGSSRFNDRSGLGRFGMGLPNSSVSQCRQIELYSWQTGQPIFYTYLDIDEISEGVMTQIPIPWNKPLPSWAVPLADKSGTLVVWRKCDRLDYRRTGTITQKLQAPLGRKFRYFLFDGIKILVNGEPIHPIDPLYCHENSILSGAEEFRPMMQYQIRSAGLRAVSSPIRVRFSRLPILKWHNWSNTQKRYYGVSGGAGVSIVRSKREIAYGWYFMGKKRRQNYDDWWRCEISFDPALDECFGVNHSKQDISPTEELHAILSPDIQSIANRLNALTRHDFIQAKLHTKPKSTSTAEKRDRWFPLPSPKWYSAEETQYRSQKIKYQIQTHRSLKPEFFSWDFERNVLRVNINEHHPFFTHVYQPLKEGNTYRIIHDLECLLLSYARSETALTPEIDQIQIAELRTKWSHILAALLV